MNEIQYIGEHLWIGKIGHLAIVLSFVASLFSALSYSFGVKSDQERSWVKMGRVGFWTHAVSVWTIMALLLYAMYNHYYEYAYVFQHVSDDLPLRYVLSAFWEGQEGSFLLWIFWHVFLGLIIIHKKSRWEAPVMAVIAMVEVFLAAMLLGVHIPWGDETVKLGINPMLLLRDTMDAPIFANADYVSLIQGNGLNPLLQNYWMTIHPPVTFLGFASTVVPFAFAIAGLWKGEYIEWLKPAQSWALFSAGILGSGILMGGFWAYEALSFGGYWAWDPVENAVLVPWLTLIAGIHTHLVARSTGYSIRPTIFFYIISFVLIVYSTFLTRSGVLGDTSVHAFTEMGLETMLIIFQVFFLALGFGWFFYRYKSIPAKKKEESIYSREFWMFIGSLILLFSALLIIGSTSLPVFNSIMSYFDEGYVGRVIQDPITHYNKYQLWIAVFIAVLSSKTMFLRYAEKNHSQRLKKILPWFLISLVIAIILTYLTTFWFDMVSWQYYLLAVSSYFTIVANIIFFFKFMSGNLKVGAASLAHFGFGIMIIGVLSSGLNKQVISSNPFIFKNLFAEGDVDKYVRLIKDKPMFAQGYWMTYESDTLIDRIRYYEVNFKKTEGEEQKVVDEFTLYPDAVYSNDFKKVASFNPDTKHYLHKDIFACIVALAPTRSDVEAARAFEDTLQYTTHRVALGDTLETEENFYIVDELNRSPQHEEFNPAENDFGVEVVGRSWSKVGRTEEVLPFRTALGLQGNLLYKYPYIEEDLGMRIRPADTLMDLMYLPEDRIDYESIKLKQGQSYSLEDTQLTLLGFSQSPDHPSYKKEDGDIAVAAHIKIEQGGQSYEVKPVYIIRGTQQLDIKSYHAETGTHIRFSGIDPENEEFYFFVAKHEEDLAEVKIPIEIAEEIPRSDYIILMANIYPGINLFWAGSILMMIALFFSAYLRFRQHKRLK